MKKFLSNHRIDVGLSVESSGVFMRVPWDDRSRATVSEDSLVTLASSYFEAHAEMSRRNVTCPANKDRAALPSGVVNGAQLPQYAETRWVCLQLNLVTFLVLAVLLVQRGVDLLTANHRYRSIHVERAFVHAKLSLTSVRSFTYQKYFLNVQDH